MTISRYEVNWTGIAGPPGVSRFYGGNLAVDQAFIDQLRTMFLAAAPYLPNSVDITFSNKVRKINETTGQATGEDTVTAPAQVDGTGGNVWAGPVGGGWTWNTGAFTSKNHRIQGRTMLVPMSLTAYEANGTLAGAAVTALQNAANTFLAGAGANLIVWRRPVLGAGGGFNLVTSATVYDKAYVLKSRRD